MIQTFHIQSAKNDEQIKDIANLAEIIWNQHFTPIIGKEQVDYMVEKLQSYPAIKNHITKDGYEYFEIFCDNTLAGYTGIHAEAQALFLSKLYIHPDFRGRHLATKAFQYLIDICKERGLKKIWLTCNKHNDNTLKIYDHLGLQITDSQVADIGNGFVMDDYILTYEI